jgi:hypothetical protein
MTSPSSNTLNSIWGTSATNIYAVGDGGVYLRYDGSRWSIQSRPVATRLNDIKGTGQTMFLAGNTGTLMRHPGDDWWTVQTELPNNLNSVWGATMNDFFAVGDNGLIMRYGLGALTVGTIAASNITATSATLNGALLALGAATTVGVSFEYGLTATYGSTTTPQNLTAQGLFTANVTSLTTGSTYHFRPKADGGTEGIAYGPDAAFVPATPPPTVAETALAQGIETGDVAVVQVKINRGKNPVNGSTVAIPGGISAFSATASSAAATGNKLGAFAGMEFSGVVESPPYLNPTYDATTGVFGVSNVASPEQPSNSTVAKLKIKLTGDKDTTYNLNVTFNQITAVTGGANIPEDSAKTIAFKRGDTNGNGVVDVFDAMFIAQYIVGNRTIDTIRPVNAACVKHDTGGDRIDVFDAMFIAQMIVGIRNSRFE